MGHFDLSHVHHYVPEWYQKRFLSAGEGQLYRLDLKPQRIDVPNGRSYYPKACLRRPPSRCFCTEDLYMLRFGSTETDAIERHFFGAVDKKGAWAMNVFAGLGSLEQLDGVLSTSNRKHPLTDNGHAFNMLRPVLKQCRACG